MGNNYTTLASLTEHIAVMRLIKRSLLEKGHSPQQVEITIDKEESMAADPYAAGIAGRVDHGCFFGSCVRSAAAKAGVRTVGLDEYDPHELRQISAYLCDLIDHRREGKDPREEWYPVGWRDDYERLRPRR